MGKLGFLIQQGVFALISRSTYIAACQQLLATVVVAVVGMAGSVGSTLEIVGTQANGAQETPAVSTTSGNSAP